MPKVRNAKSQVQSAPAPKPAAEKPESIDLSAYRGDMPQKFFDEQAYRVLLETINYACDLLVQDRPIVREDIIDLISQLRDVGSLMEGVAPEHIGKRWDEQCETVDRWTVAMGRTKDAIKAMEELEKLKASVCTDCADQFVHGADAE